MLHGARQQEPLRGHGQEGGQQSAQKRILCGAVPGHPLPEEDAVDPQVQEEPQDAQLEEDVEGGIVGGAVQGSARAFPTPLTAFFGRNTVLTKLFPNNSITRKNVLTKRCTDGKPMEVDWISGACMVLRREAIRDVGLMDKRFFLYWEDADWCTRMWEKGWKVVYYPKPAIIHYVGGSSSKKPIRSLFEFHKNCYKFINKYNRPYLKFISPFIAGTIACRLVLSILFHKTGPQLKRLMSHWRDNDRQINQSEKQGDASVFCPPEHRKAYH